MSLTAEYLFDRFQSDDALNVDFPQHVDSMIVPVTVRYFAPGGIFGSLRASYVRQEVDRQRPTPFEPPAPRGSNDFVVLDAAVGYRLPKRRGIVALEGLNLLNESFGFEDDNFRIAERRSGRFIPERTVFLRLTLSF